MPRQLQEIVTRSRDIRCSRGDRSRQRDDVMGDWSFWRIDRERGSFPSAKAQPLPSSREPRSKSVQPATIHAKVRQQLQFALILDPHTVLECLDLMSSSIQSAAISRSRTRQAA